MCEIMVRWENELISKGKMIGFANGEKAGFANGEKASAIRTCRDFGKSQRETVNYLTHSLHLNSDEAREAMEKYWEK